MRQIFFLLVVIFYPFCAAAGGHVIGNGGDGLVINRRLYLRDLVEAGVDKRPYFGEEISPYIQKRLRLLSWNHSSLPFREDLLARKLTDLEKLSPNLGRYLLDVILRYEWIPVSLPLEGIPDPGQIFKTLPQEKKQIANRLDSTIRIHWTSWLELSNEHRVALILHEAIYSLLKPVCFPVSKSCYQSARQARSITGLIFTRSSFDRPSLAMSDILPYLDVPHQWIDTASFDNKRSWTLLWIATNAPVASFTLHSSIPLYDGHFMKMVEMSCQKFEADSRKYPGQFVVLSTISVRPYEVDFIDYQTQIPTKYGTKTGRQTRVSIRLRSGGREQQIQYKFSHAKETCTQALYKHYQIAIKDE